MFSVFHGQRLCLVDNIILCYSFIYIFAFINQNIKAIQLARSKKKLKIEKNTGNEPLTINIV